MDLRIEPKNVDVNMHPTKHEVNFLYENEIVDKIKAAFDSIIMVSQEAKETYTQQLLPGASNPTIDVKDQSSSLLSTQAKETKVYAKSIIRYDNKEQKLEKFFGKNTSLDGVISSNELNQSNDNDSSISFQKPITSTQLNTTTERKYVEVFFFTISLNLFLALIS